MRAFGFDFSLRKAAPTVKAPSSLLLADRRVMGAAPLLPFKRGNDQPVIEKLPPFGTNAPTGPMVTADGNLSDRLVTNDPRELWYLSLPSKLSPKQVLQILRAALGGDLWQQWQLHRLMQDSWPMYRKCLHELFEPVSNARYVVHPYLISGDEPTDLAQEKADLVRRAMKNLQPNQFSDEKGWAGFAYFSCDAVANGMTMNEILWHPVGDWGAGAERLPRAFAWVHPRHYTFTNDGQVAIFDRDYNRLMFPLAGSPGMAAPDPRKFICAQFLSGAGSSLGAGFMRPLAWYWASVVFNREWMLKTAQNYGAPFLDVIYQTGMSADDLNRLDKEIAAGLANRFIRHVEGTTLAVTPAQSLGSDNPQRYLAELADQACTFLLLGQEATTKTQPGSMGGKDQSKEKVKRERVEGVARWLGTEVCQHFVNAVLKANYGNDPEALREAPTMDPDFTEATDPMAQATRDQILIASGIPMVAEEFYRANNLTIPEEGDLILKGGTLGFMAAPQKDVGAPPPVPGGFDADGNQLPPVQPGAQPAAAGQNNFGKPKEGEGGDDKAEAREVGRLEKVLVRATTAELAELLGLVQAAENATHVNGEFTALDAHVERIAGRS